MNMTTATGQDGILTETCVEKPRKSFVVMTIINTESQLFDLLTKPTGCPLSRQINANIHHQL